MTDETKNIDDELDDSTEVEYYGDDDELEDDLEYDEDGNIILEYDEEDDDTPSENEDTDEEDEAENEETEETIEEQEEVAEDTTPVTPAPDYRDSRIAQLEAELNAIKSQAQETLKSLGRETTDVTKGLMQVAAEQNDMSVDEYAKKMAKEREIADAIEFKRRAVGNAQKAQDLQDLMRAYPEARGFAKVEDMPNFQKFAQFRLKGLSATEAYAAANPNGVRQAAVQSAQQKSLNDTKSHLKTSVPKGAKDNSVKMSKQELHEWRDLFPGKSDKELAKLYRDSL